MVAIQRLDKNFFRVPVFDRLTRAESASPCDGGLGPGAHAQRATLPTRLVSSSPDISPVRAKLIQKGLIYSPGSWRPCLHRSAL